MGIYAQVCETLPTVTTELTVDKATTASETLAVSGTTYTLPVYNAHTSTVSWDDAEADCVAQSPSQHLCSFHNEYEYERAQLVFPAVTFWWFGLN